MQKFLYSYTKTISQSVSKAKLIDFAITNFFNKIETYKTIEAAHPAYTSPRCSRCESRNKMNRRGCNFFHIQTKSISQDLPKGERIVHQITEIKNITCNRENFAQSLPGKSLHLRYGETSWYRFGNSIGGALFLTRRCNSTEWRRKNKRATEEKWRRKAIILFE